MTLPPLPLHFGCLLMAVVTCSSAATHLVEIRDYYFTPTNLNIHIGDTVTWSNAALQTHDSTGSQWASANIEPRATYSRLFSTLGAFPYFCQQHIFQHPEQTGQVIVAEASLPPPIAITNPPNDARFLAPANVPIEISITNGITLTNVQFLLNDGLLAESLFPPFQAFADELGAGNYSLTVLVLDDAGMAFTSAPVVIQVLTNARLSSPIRSGNAFRLRVEAIVGQTYIAEFSTDFTNWQPFATAIADTTSLSFTNSPAPENAGFYRVRQDLE